LYYVKEGIFDDMSGWIRNWFNGGPTDKTPKRLIEDEDANKSRKKRLSVAVNEVEAALSRLREVTSTVNVNGGETTTGDVSETGEVTELALSPYLQLGTQTAVEELKEVGGTFLETPVLVKEESPKIILYSGASEKDLLEFSDEQDIWWSLDEDLNDGGSFSEIDEEYQQRIASVELGSWSVVESEKEQSGRNADDKTGSHEDEDIEIRLNGSVSPDIRQLICTSVDKTSAKPALTAYVFPLSPMHRPSSPAISFCPTNSPLSSLKIPSLSLSPTPNLSTSPNDFQSPPKREVSPPKTDIPHVRPFAIERCDISYVTPRSPARQARLERNKRFIRRPLTPFEQMQQRRLERDGRAERQRRLERLLRSDFDLERESSEESIYTPRFKATSSHESSDWGSVQRDSIEQREKVQEHTAEHDNEEEQRPEEEFKVWDAKIVNSDCWGVYLTRDC